MTEEDEGNLSIVCFFSAVFFFLIFHPIVGSMGLNKNGPKLAANHIRSDIDPEYNTKYVHGVCLCLVCVCVWLSLLCLSQCVLNGWTRTRTRTRTRTWMEQNNSNQKKRRKNNNWNKEGEKFNIDDWMIYWEKWMENSQSLKMISAVLCIWMVIRRNDFEANRVQFFFFG